MDERRSLVPGHRQRHLAVFHDLAVLRPPVIMLSMSRLAASISYRHRTLLLVLLAVLCAASAGLVFAIDDIELEIDHVSGPGWNAHGVVVDAALPANSTQISAQIRVRGTVIRMAIPMRVHMQLPRLFNCRSNDCRVSVTATAR